MNAFFHSEITTRLSRENREFDCNIFTDGQPKYRRLKNLSTRWTLPPIYRWLCWLVGSTITDPTLRKIKSQLTDMDTFAVVRISQISSSQRSREGAFFTSYVIYSVGVKCLLFSFSVLTHLKRTNLIILYHQQILTKMTSDCCSEIGILYSAVSFTNVAFWTIKNLL